MILKASNSKSIRASIRIKDTPKNVALKIPATTAKLASLKIEKSNKRRVAPVKTVNSKSKAPPKKSK